jgi:hypothetical protein
MAIRLLVSHFAVFHMQQIDSMGFSKAAHDDREELLHAG